MGFFNFIFGSKTARVKAYLRLMFFLHRNGFPGLARLVKHRLERRHSILVSNYSKVPVSVILPHPIGIVIGRGVKIGERVKIFQNVTLGGRELGSAKRDEFPEIGDDTVIFAGAIVVGKVRIGNNCIIGANSVVLSDVPDNSTCVGVPARVIGRPR